MGHRPGAPFLFNTEIDAIAVATFHDALPGEDTENNLEHRSRKSYRETAVRKI